MEKNNYEFEAPYGRLTAFLIRLAGADPETLAQCPPRDLDNVKAVSFIMLGVWIYQTALLSIVGHRMIAEPGTIRPEIIGGAVLIATIVLLVDSFMIMRSSWHLHGIQELDRGGIDISGGIGLKIKNGIFLVFRLALSVVLAQLMAVFIALILFANDTAKETDRIYQQANATLFAEAATREDQNIDQARQGVLVSDERLRKLDAESAELRGKLISPEEEDPSLKSLRDQVEALQQDQRRAAARLSDAEEFSANELAGIRASAENSGKPGVGPRRKAAEERVAAARKNAEDVGRALDAARTELGIAQDKARRAADLKRDQANKRLTELSGDITAERLHNQVATATYGSLTENREASIRARVEQDPSRVDRDDSFLAQLRALRILANDREIAIIIILIDLAMFGIEIAAVLAKVTSFVPTAYATTLAKESYLQALQTARSIAREINIEAAPATPRDAQMEERIEIPEAEDDGQNADDDLDKPDGFTSLQAILNNAAPRRRGRPPKAGPHRPSPDPTDGLQF
jgi:hypothetical protein